MNNSHGKALVITKINFRHSKPTYIITAILVLLGCVDMFMDCTITPPGTGSEGNLNVGNYLYMAILLAPIFIPALNFSKIMRLNGKKIDFYWGTLLNYITLSAIISILNLIIFSISNRVFGKRFEILNLIEVFGWYRHGFLPAFLQQFAFLLLTEVFIHTLTALQTNWIGWVTDIAIVAIISTFTPIPYLRSSLRWFFNMIIFNSNPFIQILFCLVLSAAIYWLYLKVLEKKRI